MGSRSERHQEKKKRFRIKVAYGSLGLLLVAGLAALLATGEEPRLKDRSPQTERPASVDLRPEPAKEASLMLALAAATDSGGRHALALLAPDLGKKRLTVVVVPADTRFNLPGFGWTGVDQAMRLAGVGGVVAAVENTLRLKIPHYLYLVLSAGEELGEMDFPRIPGRAGHSDLSAPELGALERKLSKLNVRSVELPTVTVASGRRPARQPDVAASKELFSHVTRVKAEDRPEVLILNGNGAPGVGLSLGIALVREGYAVVGTGNAKDAAGRDDFAREESEVISYKRDASPIARVHRLLGVGKITVEPPSADAPADIVVVLGRDYLELLGRGDSMEPQTRDREETQAFGF